MTVGNTEGQGFTVQTPRRCECSGSPHRPLWCGLCLGVLPTGEEFVVLRAEVAKLRDALQDLVTVCEADPTFNDPAKEPDSYAALWAAKGALER